jgi:protein phosphatase
VAALSSAEDRIGETDLTKTFTQRLEDLVAYTDAYRRYCWPVESLTDLKLAPFHLLASEGAVHVEKPHDWHMRHLHALASADPELLRPTIHLGVDTTDPESERAATKWWTEPTESGGEGMVVKPMDFIVRGRRGLAQPAVKVRGKQYLRIIYGPEYAEPQNLERLRERSIGAKRSLAVREFALGVEALERFVREEPLRRVHECCFGVLALESEPVDPRL